MTEGQGETFGAGAGGVESRIDPDRLDAFLAVGAEVRSAAVADGARARHLEEAVAADCGLRAVAPAALDNLSDLLRRLGDHEDELLALGQRIRAADVAGTAALGAAASRWAGVSALVPARGSMVASGLAVGVGASGRLNPWLDPNSDSWVVNVLRAATGPGFTPAFVERLSDDGPGVLGRLGRIGIELSPVNQQRLIMTDPVRFVRNWGRAGLGVLDALRGLAEVSVAATALLAPAGDRSIRQLTGRQPGQELLAHLASTGRLMLADPDVVVESQIGWQLLMDDPYRWLGTQAPAVAAELFSFGGGEVLAPGARLARTSARATESALADAAVADGAELVANQALAEATLAEATLAEATLAEGALAEATLAEGALAAGAESPAVAARARQLPNLADYRLREPEWIDAGPVVSHRVAPFESPENWVQDLNGAGRSAPGRSVNCVDTTRAAEANWRGQDAVAAPLAPWLTDGTTAARLEDWSGGLLAPTTIDGIQARLTELGSGSSAMVVVEWGQGGAHAFNAVNDGGMVKWVDAQLGQTSTWPPSYAPPIATSKAIFIDPLGRPL